MKVFIIALLILGSVTELAIAQWTLRGRRCARSEAYRAPRTTAEPMPAATNPQPDERALFNGRDLAGWEIIEKYDFARHGEIRVEQGEIVLGAGKPATGIRIAGDFPRMNYEVTLEAKRIEGSDFFCGITFPVGEDYLSLILGGWGGGTTGISNLDNMSAIENVTSGFQEFDANRWYAVRLRVTDTKVEAWIDDEQIVDVEHPNHKLSIWWEQEPVRPFGIASWYTESALRRIQLTHLK